jgi:hypothetical protein
LIPQNVNQGLGGVSPARIKAKGLPQLWKRVLRAVRAQVQKSKVRVPWRKVRLCLNNLAKHFFCAFVLVLEDADHPEQIEGAIVSWTRAEHSLQILLSLLQVTGGDLICCILQLSGRADCSLGERGHACNQADYGKKKYTAYL